MATQQQLSTAGSFRIPLDDSGMCAESVTEFLCGTMAWATWKMQVHLQVIVLMGPTYIVAEDPNTLRETGFRRLTDVAVSRSADPMPYANRVSILEYLLGTFAYGVD